MIRASKEFNVGHEIPSLSKLVTVEVSQVYSGWPAVRNFHTDEEIAHSLGFPAVVAQGGLGVEYLSQMCMRFFGEGWVNGGELSINFIGIILLPQRVTAKGVIREKVIAGNSTRFVLDVWLENEQGEKVQVGSASAYA